MFFCHFFNFSLEMLVSINILYFKIIKLFFLLIGMEGKDLEQFMHPCLIK